MQNKSYPSKWLITYQGKPYASVYGKKKAYDLCIRLSHCVNGLQVEAAPKRQSTRTRMDKREYHREWRANNKDKVREYNRRSYQKRKQKKLAEQIREEGLEILESIGALQQEAYMEYVKWLRADVPAWMRSELLNMSESEINECFGRNLEFGTGGLRGEIGLGPNRMNQYTVRKVTQGLADHLRQTVKDRQISVAIAYDSRRFSRQFAEEAALVLAHNRIKAYIFEDICPTPILSFAVRYLQTSAGIVITASHNPPSYNGYKVYGADGAQISTETTVQIMNKIDHVADELAVRTMDKQAAISEKLFMTIGQEVHDAYFAQLQTIICDKVSIKDQADKLKIVYTSLHGSGAAYVLEALARAGFTQVYPVQEQLVPDGNFPTVRTPNPEDPASLELALRLAEEVEADIVLGTDPDTDRVGVAVRSDDGTYVCLNGNEMGVLMLDYRLGQLQKHGRLPENGVMMKTVVTSELGRAIASSYGVETIETLTGFKYIGEKIRQLEESGEKCFLFGYEESYGYLVGDFVRDKDAVQACLFICEMAAYYKNQNRTLLDGLEVLHEKFGYYMEDQHSIVLEGIEGMVRINEIMNYLRKHLVPQIDGLRVSWIRDFERGTEFHLSSNMLRAANLPRSNVLHYTFVNTAWFAVRPSGTEPKLKIYISTNGATREEAEQQMEQLKSGVLTLLENIQIHLGLQVVPK